MTDVREAAVNFEAVKVSMSQTRDGIILRLALHPNECPPSLHTDWVGSRYMVAMVKLNDQDEPEVSDQQIQTEKLIKSAGMLCRNYDFAKYLFDRDILVSVSQDDVVREQTVSDALREHLGIKSRTEMRNNSEAREAFKNLSEGFKRWKQGRPQ